MSARVLFSAVALIVFSYTFPLRIFSQDELGIPKLEKSNDYWSIGYYASGNLSLINDYTKHKDFLPGYGGTFEFTYHNPNAELIFLIGKNRISSQRENEHFETFEFSLGPRLTLNKKGDLFTEFTAGGLTVSRFYWPYDWEYYNYPYHYSDAVFRFGLMCALGKKFSVNNNTDILLKLRMLTTISFDGDNLTYMVLNGGIAFNTKKLNTKPKEDKVSYVGITAFCGGTNPGFLSQWEYNWGINYGGEVSYKTSPKTEFNLGGNYNRVIQDQISTVDKASFSSVTLGGRFYINENHASAFIEFSGGLYSYRIKHIEPYAGYDYVDEFGGLNAGTGIKFVMNSLFDILLKTNMNLLFNDTSADMPNFISVNGGLRFNL